MLELSWNAFSFRPIQFSSALLIDADLGIGSETYLDSSAILSRQIRFGNVPM